VGGDEARDIFLTLTNDWYEDNPFQTIEAFVTAISADDQPVINNNNNVIISELPQQADIKLSDLGISSTSDIIDSERQLRAPTAVVPRLYIERIGAGETYEVTIRLKADTHMVKGRAYKEFVLLEYIDSDGSYYYYEPGNPISTQPLPLIIQTKESDDWPEEEGITSETLAVILIIIIIIIIILLFLGSIYQKRRMKEEEEPAGERKYGRFEDEYPEDEDLEEEDLEDEDLEDELPEDMKEEEEPEEKEEDKDEWTIDEEPEEEEPEEEEPEEEEPEEEEDEEEDENDWVIDEEPKKPSKGKPVKGKMPLKVKPKGKKPGKGPAEDDEDIEDW
jgi:hypothetical protein